MKVFFIITLLHGLGVSLDLQNIRNVKNWNRLQSGSITIEWCQYKSFPISKAETIFKHDIQSIAKVIKDLDSYPTIFKRVTKTQRLGKSLVHIILDMPFPFDGRDYIVKYDILEKTDSWVFSFSTPKNNDTPIVNGHVRLVNAAGVWILNKTSKNKTKVTYAWNGELLGNFPDFGLEKAWITQGTEVLNWLDQALIRQKKS